MGETELARAVAMRLREGEGPTALFGLTLETIGVGHARVSMTVTAQMLNGVGTAHGGVIFTLADTAFAYACNSRNSASVAQHAAISFLQPAMIGDVLTAEATELALEGRSGVYAVRVSRLDGATVAIFEGLSRTLGRSIIDPPAPRLDPASGFRAGATRALP